MGSNREHCKELQFTLLRLLRSPILATSFIRELDMTAPCDHYYDDSGLRDRIRADLGISRTERILDFTSNTSDELKAIQ